MTETAPENVLYYGDNLDVLRRHVRDESVDFVYLDPPFNSNQNYNVLFAEQDGDRSAAQIKAFSDTWRWDRAASAALWETVSAGGQVAQTLLAFQKILDGSNMLAYLAMMAPRLIELRRVLRKTGSIYLHCDPTASHYLKLLMDSVFGPENFRTARSSGSGRAPTRARSAMGLCTTRSSSSPSHLESSVPAIRARIHRTLLRPAGSRRPTMETERSHRGRHSQWGNRQALARHRRHGKGTPLGLSTR